jgi:hypothetical protein
VTKRYVQVNAAAADHAVYARAPAQVTT